jgi:hypothetical protein
VERRYVDRRRYGADRLPLERAPPSYDAYLRERDYLHDHDRYHDRYGVRYSDRQSGDCYGDRHGDRHGDRQGEHRDERRQPLSAASLEAAPSRQPKRSKAAATPKPVSRHVNSAVGQRLQARDKHGHWYKAKVTQERWEGEARTVRVHVKNWNKARDEWIVTGIGLLRELDAPSPPRPLEGAAEQKEARGPQAAEEEEERRKRRR